jgi:diadenosine tetraphosphate (Ap4A) HIT family hydrolase
VSRGVSEREYTCDVCSFSLWLPIARLGVATLGLYDDARFPGRCLLVLHRHAEHFTDLDATEAGALAQDLRIAGRAIAAVTKPVRVNYALLGNKAPHVHFHLIPRPASDPVPHMTPWHHPDPLTPLGSEERVRLISALGEELASSR